MLGSLYRFAIIAGFASQYALGVMPSTVRVRQSGSTAHNLPTDLPSVDGYVASQNCADIGSIIWLRPIGQTEWESFLVADCASLTAGSPRPGESSYRWMVRNNILFEIDGLTARRWNTVGRRASIEMRVPIGSPRYEYR